MLNRSLETFDADVCLSLDPLLANVEKKRSTQFSQEAEVGVKWTL